MPAVIIGQSYVFGSSDPLPLRGFPEGRVKIRVGPEDFAQVIVRTPDRLRAFYVAEQDGHWVPGVETIPHVYGNNSARAFIAMRKLLNRYRVLLFGKDYQADSIETIRALATHDDPNAIEAFTWTCDQVREGAPANVRKEAGRYYVDEGTPEVFMISREALESLLTQHNELVSKVESLEVEHTNLLAP